MCLPPHRSKYNYSASQWSPFIFSSATWSPGCDVNMRERSYQRISESERGSQAHHSVEGLMHSHPHRLTHSDKRVCVAYSGQLGRTVKLGLLCCPGEKSAFVVLLRVYFTIRLCMATQAFSVAPRLRKVCADLER